ncbi:MAG: hypothetical protein ACOYBP_08980 [Microbacteriaceae bacterium]
MPTRLDLTSERLDKRLTRGERLVFTLEDIKGFESLDGYSAEAWVITWLKGLPVTTALTCEIDTAEDTLKVTLSKEQSATLPPLCEYRIRLVSATEPETILEGSLYLQGDGGLI